VSSQVIVSFCWKAKDLIKKPDNISLYFFKNSMYVLGNEFQPSKAVGLHSAWMEQPDTMCSNSASAAFAHLGSFTNLVVSHSLVQ
jgi:hypothetical protein